MVNSGLGVQPDAKSCAAGMDCRIDVLEHLMSLVDSLQCRALREKLQMTAEDN